MTLAEAREHMRQALDEFVTAIDFSERTVDLLCEQAGTVDAPSYKVETFRARFGDLEEARDAFKKAANDLYHSIYTSPRS